MRLSPCFVIAVVAAAATGCQRNDAPVPELSVAANAPMLAYGRSAAVDVAAAKEWQSAGVKLARGASYRISAQGTWSIGAGCGVTDANGTGVSPFCNADHLGIGASGSALIGRIGREGRPFLVGTNKVLTPEIEGELFLRSYDMIPGDNTGSISVRVAVEDSAAGAEPVPAHRDPI